MDEPFELPDDKSRTAVAYDATEPVTAYVEPLAVGNALPSLPIFLVDGIYVSAPLEETYEKTWTECPEAMREFVQNPYAK